MNIINKFFLSAVLLPQRFYARLGINVSHLKSILRNKLIMDDRRPNTFQQTRQRKKEKEVSLATIGTMFFSAVLGCFFLFSFFVGNNYVTQFTLYFSMYIFMLCSTLISDFTSVLIDVRDNFIILPKPVNDRTVVTARLLHIFAHINKIILPMSLPGLIYVGINISLWGVVVLLLLILLATLFTIFLINALYIFILRVTTPQKFQSVISYFQIFFAILIYASYQIVPRVISQSDLADYSIENNHWLWLAPSYWFSGAFTFLSAGNLELSHIVALMLSITVPVLSIWIVVKFLAPSFNQKLALINSTGAETNVTIQKAKPATSAYVQKLANLFTQKGAERMSFLFCWKMTARSRDFKMKVYPAFGYMLVYAVVMFMNNKNISLGNLRSQTTAVKALLLSGVYFGSFVLLMAIYQIVYSNKFKAAWVYFIAPVQKPGKFISGALKATLCKFYIPVAVVISLPAIMFIGVKIIPNLLFGLLNVLLICSLIGYINIRQLPFSVQQTNPVKAGGFIRTVFTLVIQGIIALIHFFIYDYLPAVTAGAILSLTCSWFVFRSLNNKSWFDVKMSYAD